MGKNPTGDRKYQIQTVWAQHKEIARRLVLGEKHVDIARDMGITPAMVSYTANSHLVQQEMAVLMAKRDGMTVDIAQDIQELQPLALLKVVEAMIHTDATPADSARIGFGILDRGGNSVVKKTINMNGTLTPADIEEIKERGRKNLKASRAIKEEGIEEAEVVTQ